MVGLGIVGCLVLSKLNGYDYKMRGGFVLHRDCTCLQTGTRVNALNSELYVCNAGYICMHVWMDERMHGCFYACMVGYGRFAGR